MRRLLTFLTVLCGMKYMLAGVVTGLVTDANDGSPLPFCTVQAVPGSHAAVTDAEGHYRLELADGNYTLKVSYVGFTPLSRALAVKGRTHLDISLRPNAYTLGEVVVTAKEGEGMSSGSKIDRSAMDHLQPSSFTDLLELIPGNISKDPDLTGANSITLRETGNLGATGTAVANDDYSITSLGTLFIVDGAPVNTDANMQTIGTSSDASSPDYKRNITNKGVDMRTISTDNIESVEIIRGIPSAEYGNLSSGMVNIRRIHRATPFTARFKADGYSKLLFAGKGFGFRGYQNVLNVDLGYLDAKSDPRDSRETYKRLNASARFSAIWQREAGRIDWNLSADYSGSFDNTKTDPDLSLRKVDEYRSSYNRSALTSEVSFLSSGKTWLERAQINTSVSYQNDILQRRRQVAPSRPTAAPSTMAEGVSDGYFLLGEYIADYRSEGRPFNFFLKGSVSGRASTGLLSNSYKAGVEYSISKNFGEGQIYDLSRPLSASWSSRPRRFIDIPAYHVLSVFAQNQFTFDFGQWGDINMQCGLRTQSLPRLDSRYRLAGKVYVDPRLNILWHIRRWGAFTPFIGGGYGVTTKMPTIDYLYPQEHYTDIIQLNYYDIERPAEHSRLNLRTYINDATNYDLRAARNFKWELRAGFSWKGNSLSVTYFNERMRSGYRYSTIYSPVEYTLYDASGIISSALTSPPDLSALPSQQMRVLSGFRRAGNGSRIDKEGIEFQFNSARWETLRTALTVTGAWFRSKYSNSQMLYSPVSDVVDNQAIADIYIGLYDYYDGRVNNQFNTNFMFDTQLNRWGLVFTTTLQCMWFVSSRQMPKNGTPAYYLSAEDGELHPFTADDADDIYLSKLIKPFNDNLFNTVRIPVAMYLNLKATKRIGPWINVSVFVNRILDYLPDYKINGLTIRRNSDAYFGMELNIKI